MLTSTKRLSLAKFITANISVDRMAIGLEGKYGSTVVGVGNRMEGGETTPGRPSSSELARIWKEAVLA